MQVPDPSKQEFSIKTLRGFLLKNVDRNNTDSRIQMLNEYIEKRVDNFLESVVIPLKNEGILDGNKVNWYFEIFKEGLEARKVAQNPFTFLQVTPEVVQQIVDLLKEKTIVEYCELGTSFLTSCFTVLTAWHRDRMILERLRTVYSSENPVDWIKTAEKEEHGIMTQNVDADPDVQKVLSYIQTIMSRRV